MVKIPQIFAKNIWQYSRNTTSFFLYFIKTKFAEIFCFRFLKNFNLQVNLLRNYGKIS